jgi:hypothetical protein
LLFVVVVVVAHAVFLENFRFSNLRRLRRLVLVFFAVVYFFSYLFLYTPGGTNSDGRFVHLSSVNIIHSCFDGQSTCFRTQ